MRSTRDWEAVRISSAGFLASVGALALIIWPLSHWLADFAIYPPDPNLAAVEHWSLDEQTEASKRDYQSTMNHIAARLAVILAVYWILAFVLGAARLEERPEAMHRRPTLWLGLGLVTGIVLAFLGAARRFAIDPVVETCVRRQVAADPSAAFTSATIHGCEGQTGLYFGLGGLILMIGFMGWSLRLRYRRRVTADASAE